MPATQLNHILGHAKLVPLTLINQTLAVTHPEIRTLNQPKRI